MASPTREDAALLMQVIQWGTTLGIQDAMPELFSDDFDPNTADAIEHEAVRTILMFGETIATLTQHDLLSTELVTDWLWVQGLWSRVEPAARSVRERFGEPRLYENFEALARNSSGSVP